MVCSGNFSFSYLFANEDFKNHFSISPCPFQAVICLFYFGLCGNGWMVLAKIFRIQ
jgi:hypothetical protein